MTPVTLSDGTTALNLPYDLIWSDRNTLPVAQSSTRSVTGKLILMSAIGEYGRPITLVPPSRGGWWQNPNEDKIREWLATPEKKLTLNWRGETHTVMFRQTEGTPYESEPVFYDVIQGPEYIVRPTLRLITVET